MEFLTQDEIASIFEQWLTRRVKRINEPTKFFCALCSEPGYGKYLHVCTDMAQHKNIKLIYEFDANSSNDLPDKEKIKRSVEKEWNLLSDLKRSDYEQELKEARESS